MLSPTTDVHILGVMVDAIAVEASLPTWPCPMFGPVDDDDDPMSARDSTQQQKASFPLTRTMSYPLPTDRASAIRLASLVSVKKNLKHAKSAAKLSVPVSNNYNLKHTKVYECLKLLLLIREKGR